MDRPYFNGIGYVPTYHKCLLSPEIAAGLMEELGAVSVRLWHPFMFMMDRPDHIIPEAADYIHEVISLLRRHGLRQIISVNHEWFIPDAKGEPVFRGFGIPHRDTDSYRLVLEWYEKAWSTQAKEFPEVDGWETGNEMNHVPFLHASDVEDRGEFTLMDRADLCTDLMLCSARAIRRHSPDSLIVMPGIAPIGGNRIGVVADNIAVEYDGIVQTLERIYQNIESGRFGSTDPRDFFDKLCWHPYYARQNDQGDWSFMCPDEQWVALNRQCYQVAVHHNDGGVGCYLSEYGFNDWASSDEDRKLAGYLSEGLRLAREQLPFVDSVQVYRLFNYLNRPDVWDDYSLYDCKAGHPVAKAKARAVRSFFHSH